MQTRAQRVDDELLGLLCCPVTHQALRIAGEAELVNASAKVSKPVSGGLVREDGKVLYPINDGIPLLVPEEGIPL
ncbi:MAG: Trm112 family protein [Terrimicrobiaceae bacterium]